jgi:putative Holliday junction resolvase
VSEQTKVLLGFDFGVKRIGVAVGQELTRTARALETLTSPDGGPDWDGITRLIEQWQPDALVVGLPLNADGSDHEVTRLARRFGNRLKGRYNLPVFSIDERLSSIEAERQLAEQGRYNKEDVDKLAARIILESWLAQQPDNNA